MTISYDAFSSNTSAGYATSHTHTPAGTPRGVIVFVQHENVTAVSYGGQPLVNVGASTPQGAGGFPGAVTWCWFLGAGLPSGPQSVVVTGPGAGEPATTVVTVAAAADVEPVDFDSWSTAAANPTVTLSAAGRSVFAALSALSGQGDTAGITPFANWTARQEEDYGAFTQLTYTYNTIATADVSAGWTQTFEEANGFAIAVSEVVSGGGGTVELDGAISSESTAEGSLQLAVGLQGGLTSVSTVHGSLGLAMPLEGAVSSVSRLSGGLGTPTVLQGTIASASAAAGTLGLVQGLTGTIRSESELTGELDSGGAIALTGTISSASQVQGQFALATALTGAIVSASNLAGDLTVAGEMSLVGTASSVSAVQGRLGLATELTGIAKSTSQAVGGLGLNLLLSSEVRSVSGVHGSLGLSTPLSGTISSESALSGELSIAGTSALVGAISSVSALRGELNLSIGLAGSSRSESSLASELTIGGELALSGTISSVSRLSGSLSLGPYIDMQESITLTAYGSVQIYSNGTRLFTV